MATILKNDRFSYVSIAKLGLRAYPGFIDASPSEMRCLINTIYFSKEEVNGVLEMFSDHETKLRAVGLCRQLYGHDSPVSIAATDLDATFSKVFEFKCEPLENSQTIIEQACRLLGQIPAWPPELNDTPTAVLLKYRASSLLQVTTYLSDNVLRAALSVFLDPEGIRHGLLNVVNVITALLEMVSQLAPTITDIRTSWRLFITRAFLWTTWQRCQLIYFHLEATAAMKHGSLDRKQGELVLRGTMPSPGATIHETSKHFAGLDKPAYMCGWNFELLRTFHQLYHAAFEGFSPRCFAVVKVEDQKTGFNHCLHDRYPSIARLLDCDSYWIDATCIPDDHQLRSEAIANINDIFMNAKFVKLFLLPPSLAIGILEPGHSSRRSELDEPINFFAKKTAVVSLNQVIQTVYQRGVLDTGILFSAMPHFLQPFDDRKLASQKFPDWNWRPEYQAGYLSIETSGDLLSHRPASRPGDDVVIWSLLISEKPVFQDAETFWKTMQGPALHRSAITGEMWLSGSSVRTGYLVSSAPRLKTRGLGWAPATPTFRFSTQSITDGLNGFDGGTLPDTQCPRKLARIRTQLLQGYRWDDGIRLRRTVVVVCGTNEMDGSVDEKYTYKSVGLMKREWYENSQAVGWEWRGVYAWDDVEPLPEWRRAPRFLIV
ncbi:hypothetical protein MMC22_005553 [Lobaria immixta]|nr:hypothetical protein [Lobaria immixta]